MNESAVEWLADEIIMLEEKLRLEEININDFMDAKDELVSKALEMEKQREKSIFSIAYRMMPKEYGKEYCEAEFEKFNKTFKSE